MLLPELENGAEFDYMKVLGLSAEQERLIRRQEINRMQARLLSGGNSPSQPQENNGAEEESGLPPNRAKILP